MITAIHALMYSKDADALRAFFRDVLDLKHVDAGRGWLIFALPPAEIAAHPAEDDASHGRCELYLMCDDIHATVAQLAAKGISTTAPIADRGWGIVTAIQLPDGNQMGLYQPRHPVAAGL